MLWNVVMCEKNYLRRLALDKAPFYRAKSFPMCAWTRNIVVLFVFMVVGSIGFSAFMASMQMLVGLTCNQQSVSLATGIIMAALNGGTFLCSSWMNVVGTLTGEPLYAAVYLGSGLCLVFAIILTWKNPFHDSDRRKAQNERATQAFERDRNGAYRTSLYGHFFLMGPGTTPCPSSPRF